MEKKYETLSNLIDIIRFSALILSCAILLSYCIKKDFDPLLFVWIPVFLLLFYFSLLMIHRFFLFLPVQLILPALAFFVPHDFISRIFCLFIGLIMFCVNLHFWFSESDQKVVIPPQGLIAVFLALSIYPAWHRDSSTCIKIYFLGILFFILGYLTKYFDHVVHIPIQSKTDDYAAAQTIQQSSLKVIKKLLLSFFVVSFLSFLPDCYVYLQNLLHLLKELLRKLFALLISRITPEKPDLITPTPTPTQAPSLNLTDLVPKQETNPLLKKMIDLLVFSIIAIVICFLLYYGIRSLIKELRLWLFKSPEKAVQKNDFAPTEKKERLVSKPHNRSPFSLSFARNINTLIRRQYHSTIKSLQKRGYTVTLSHTPKEREDDLLKKQQENIEELTVLYNKARYSQHPIKKDELTILRKRK